MSLWDKVKHGLEEGMVTISEKTSEMSKLAKMKWDRRSIEKEIHQILISMGEKVYEGRTGVDEAAMEGALSESIQKLHALEQALEAKNSEIDTFTAKIDSRQVKGLKQDLEMGDGTIEQIVVGEQSALAGKKLMEIKLPKAVLVGTIVREEAVIIPDGKTVLQAGDKITLLGKIDDVEKAKTQLEKE